LQDRVSGRVVVLTGALFPCRYSEVEAAANLGGALGVARVLGNGTYIFMHGATIRADRCRKNADTGFFETDGVD